MAKLLLSIIFGLTLCACQSTTTYTEVPTRDYDEGSHAAAAAYAAEGFVWNKSTPSRPRNDFDFYYKHCDRNSFAVHFSKTDWECSQSPFVH